MYTQRIYNYSTNLYTTLFFLAYFCQVNVSAQDNEALSAVLNRLHPVLVQPGTISTNGFEFGASVSPDGNELFFIKGIAGFRRTVFYVIYRILCF